MRLTNKLYAQHLGWTFKKHWIVQSKRTPRDTGAAAELKKIGVSVKDVVDLPEHEAYCNQEKLEAINGGKTSLRDDETHPNWNLKPCHTFGNSNVLLEGMSQALLLTKSVEIPSLPKCIRESMDGIKISGLLERKVKEAVMASHLFSADQVKLPKRRNPLRPEYNLPRDYGIPQKRRVSILINKLLSECEKFAGRNINSQRRLLGQANFKVTVPKNDDLLLFDVNVQKIITASRPLDAIKGKYDSELPDLHPIKYTISMPKQHVYIPETIYPFGGNLNGCNPHTIFVNFNNEEVKNMHDLQINVSQFQSRNLLKAFSVAAARAKQLYGDLAYKNISRPIVVQSIQTDGRTFHFGVFQLNTLRLDNLEGPKNYWFHQNNEDLFQLCEYGSGKPTLEGYNKDVFRYICAFYSNA
ncbi:39S ribosomal protein L37, mitochondrial [Anastrepha obliqua]|uniref:39S ribosomal protein L37, mitochondrial n=1 Tax=Anastrepha obliqua TaxID=95512 RepID=UPI00240A2B79|nr:39S ribosomal protein L37, mitochondrial [Anastrepha obliqua]